MFQQDAAHFLVEYAASGSASGAEPVEPRADQPGEIRVPVGRLGLGVGRSWTRFTSRR